MRSPCRTPHKSDRFAENLKHKAIACCGSAIALQNTSTEKRSPVVGAISHIPTLPKSDILLCKILKFFIYKGLGKVYIQHNNN
ncbi:hypothetical protein H6G35_00355 [Aulosira sp. FACHB-113]|uniref:hypothetical protein n=1 Tax=Tolypothrix tenuis TaxID=457083 RepID=UPI000BBBF351|nr:hypothetical protein [Aulosira sp. FACHB-113]